MIKKGEAAIFKLRHMLDIYIYSKLRAQREESKH